MCCYELIETIAISITALLAIVTLILNIIKEVKISKVIPCRDHSEYIDKFGDYINNFGRGPMIIKEINVYYNNIIVPNYIYNNSIVNLYVDKLTAMYNGKLNTGKLIWSTFVSNEEIVNRMIAPNQKIKIVEINPASNKGYPDLFKKLLEIRRNIKIEITYKSIYSVNKTKMI